MTAAPFASSVTSNALVTARSLTQHVGNGLQLMGYFSTRADVDRALSGDNLPALVVPVTDPSGRREFLITVEELS